MTAETNNIIPLPYTQFLLPSGAVNAGGSVFTYAADGTTPKATYQGSSNSVANTNPITLNSAGQALIWGQGTYVFSVYDSSGNSLYSFATQDPAASVGVSSAMLPVVQAGSTAAALALLGGQQAGTGSIPWGVPLPFAGSTAPTGFALCYGQAVSRSLYSNLFSAIGTGWGSGDGSTTFNLPDLRGRTWAGADAMGGSAAGVLTNATAGFAIAAVLGALGGSQYISNHTHSVTDPQHQHTYTGAQTTNNGYAVSGASNGSHQIGGLVTDLASTGISINTFGGGNSGNVQPTAIGNWIIALG